MDEISGVCGGGGDESGDDESGLARSDYDVFLSFRGPDTRHGIVDHLYESMTDKGICVFRDDEEIRRGEEIGGELERAIRSCRIYVVVFSKNYASSVWCLRELAMIIGCRGNLAAGKMVLPIFYDVGPNDVKLRTELYRSSLDEHRQRHEEEGVKRWEEALVKVGGIRGWDFKGYLGEGKFVRLVVQDILSKLNIRDRALPRHLVGIDDRVADVMKLLNCDSPEVRIVMVHGMGGIGKTTLVNIIFNRICSQFNGCSYLADVRESSSVKGGFATLQSKLLCDILGGPITEVGDSSNVMDQIKRRLRGKRVLIIFDDVTERSQLDKLIGNCDFFGLGTRIIVTTRDRSVCKGLAGPRAVCTYEMEEMNEDHALQLFNKHAFGFESSPANFAALSKQVVRTTGNLPLALEVIGRHLCGESKDVWEYTLQKLEQVLDKDVMRTLLISYEGLEEREKQIFLDIACLSDQMPRRYASYMWEACGLYPNWGVYVLVNKSLVKILNDDEFGMHDLIRDMGREIVCLQGLDCLGMRSRLWTPEDAVNVVRQKEGMNKVLAIKLGWLSYEHHLACEGFEGMSNLRFLQLCGGQFIGDFRNFRTKLLWLDWKLCKRVPNPSFFHMNNLVVLKISGSGITDESIKDLRMGNLRALEIGLSPMTRMPDLSCCSKLERIILQRCFHLETLHVSVGKLGYLMSLNIENCESLRSLPEEFGSAKALQELSLIDCESIEELPESIGMLGALRVLRVRKTKIRKLPASIGNLKFLEVLRFEYCPLVEDIPKEIGGLSSLEELNLDGCNLRQLPGTIHQLSRLHSLFLSHCHELRELPELPSSLTELRVVSRSLQVFPDLSSLTNLKELVLIDLRVVQDTSRQRLPVQSPWLGNKLREMPELPSSLTKLRVESVLLQPLPDLSSLMNLTELVLNDFGAGLKGMGGGHSQPLKLPWLRKLHRLQRLQLLIPVLLSTELGCLSRLQELELYSVDISSLSQLPSSLSCLGLSHFGTAVPWVHYSNLGFLVRLDLSNSTLTEIQLGGLDKLGNLASLSIDCCTNLEKLLDLSCLRKLSFLCLRTCPKLVDISGIDKMEMLEELTIHRCDSLSMIPDLSDLTRLMSVSISYCHSLRQVPCTIGKCYLDVVGCGSIVYFTEGIFLE